MAEERKAPYIVALKNGHELELFGCKFNTAHPLFLLFTDDNENVVVAIPISEVSWSGKRENVREVT